MINTRDTELCTGCGTCLRTCGLDVFRLDTDQNTINPCSQECPAGTDMRAYNALMQLGMREEAAQKLQERNPFPAITGGGERTEGHGCRPCGGKGRGRLHGLPQPCQRHRRVHNDSVVVNSRSSGGASCGQPNACIGPA